MPASSEPTITQSRAGRDRLGDVAGILDAAVGDDRDVAVAHGACGLGDRRDLRHACAGNDARGADRAGPNADLDAVGSGLRQLASAIEGADVAGQEIDFRQRRLDLPDGFDHAGRVSVSAVDGQQVDLGSHQFLRALQEVAGRADGRAHAQAAVIVFGRGGILQALLNVFDRDQAFEVVGVVDHQQLLDAMLMQDGLGIVQRGADRNRDQVLLGHHFADGNVGAGFEAEIAVGEDADQLLVLGDRHAGDAIVPHQLQRFGDLLRPATW